MQRGLAPILIVILVAVLGIGGYFVWSNYSKVQTQPAQYVQTNQIPAPTQDPTANWKTYTNSKYNYSFKYPGGWNIVFSDESSVRLRNDKLTEIVATVVTTSTTDTVEDAYQRLDSGSRSKSYIDDTKTIVSLDGNRAIQYDSPLVEGYLERHILSVQQGKVYQLYIIGDNKLSNESFSLFNQILSTFRFTQ